MRRRRIETSAPVAMVATMIATMIVVPSWLGCSPSTVPPGGDGQSSTGGSGPDPSTGVSPDTTSMPADSTSGVGSSSGSSSGPDQTFIEPNDTPGPDLQCDLFEQDCPPGEKCMPWADDGGTDWNATKCEPVIDEPDGAGEPCMVEGHPMSGTDTCGEGMMCWFLEPGTLEGTCIVFCVGDRAAPYCEDPGSECSICGSCVLPLCIPQCDPLAQDCDPGQACYPVEDEWQCAPDASGDMGAPGDPCRFINVCDPGSFCADGSIVPDCMGAAGCCSPLCALDDPMPPCLPGQDCVPWYEPGAAPRGYQNVGACALPM